MGTSYPFKNQSMSQSPREGRGFILLCIKIKNAKAEKPRVHGYEASGSRVLHWTVERFFMETEPLLRFPRPGYPSRDGKEKLQSKRGVAEV